MFDVMEQLLVQLVELMPALLGLYLIFYFTGTLFFKNK